MTNSTIYAQAAVLALCLHSVGVQAELSASTDELSASNAETLEPAGMAAKNVRGLNRGSAAATVESTAISADFDSVIKDRRGQRPDSDNYSNQDYRPKQPRRN